MAKNNSSKFTVTEGLDFSQEQGAKKLTFTEIPLDRLVPYRNHKFKLYEGERLADMVSSISKSGIMNPIIVRDLEGGKFEILSGHNRVYAAGQAGLAKVPAYIKYNLSDEEALLIVVDTNLLQRGFTDLRISEQAYAVAVRYEKLFDERKLKSITDELYFLENGKHKPAEKDTPKKKLNTREKTAAEYGISESAVARLLSINKLIDEFKALVDKEDIKVRPAVDLSALTEEQQKILYDVMAELGITKVDMKQSKLIKKIAKTCADVTREDFLKVFEGENMAAEEPAEEPSDTEAEDTADEQPTDDKGESVVISKAAYKRYLSDCSDTERSEIIEKALVVYFKSLEMEEK